MKLEIGDSSAAAPIEIAELRSSGRAVHRVECALREPCGAIVGDAPPGVMSLEIGLARVAISLEQLFDIAPGAVLDVKLPGQFPLVLRLGGVLLGPATGRIVDSTLLVSVIDPDGAVEGATEGPMAHR